MREILERATLEDFDDIAAHSALADYLLEQGDPKGEFIRVQLALEDEALSREERADLRQKEQALLDEHAADWLGPLAEFQKEMMQNPTLRSAPAPDERNWLPTFERGYLRALTIREFGVRHATAIRLAPEGRFLRTLRLDLSSNDSISDYANEDHIHEDARRGDYMPGLYVLARCTFPQMRLLHIGHEGAIDEEYERTATHNAYYSAGHWSPALQSPECHCYARPIVEVLAAMPKLEELGLFCGNYDPILLFTTKSVSHLKVLQIHHLGDNQVSPPDDWQLPHHYRLDLLAANPAFSNLEALRFHPHQPEEHDQSYLPLSQVRNLFHSPHLKKLRHLQIRLSDMGDDGVRELIDSGFLNQLRILDLRHGCITDEGAELFAKSPATKNLERLDLCRNALTPEGIERMRKAGINVRADAQQSAGELEARAYLYEGAFE
jgi:uncharacterized protein (TIGR02996 family)